MATNLFAPLSEQTKKDVLVEFKAGKMHKDTNTKWVRPDKRKGTVQLKLNADGLVHFVWKDRTTGTVENDLIIMPEDAVFRKVDESSGRIYVLDFKTSDLKLFFWMQESKDDKDKENCDNINKFINKPPQPGGGGSGGGNGGGLLDLVGGLGLDQNHLLQLLQSGGLGNLRGGRVAPSQASTSSSSSSSAAVPVAASGGSSGESQSNAPSQSTQGQPKVQLDVLKNILSSFTNAVNQEVDKGPSLKDVVNVDEIVKSGLFDNPEVVKQLAEFLPEGPVTAENLKDNIRSPQFKQAVSLFNQALRSGQLSAVMASFGLDASKVGPNDTIEDFLMAIQKKAKDENEKEEKMDTSD